MGSQKRRCRKYATHKKYNNKWVNQTRHQKRRTQSRYSDTWASTVKRRGGVTTAVEPEADAAPEAAATEAATEAATANKLAVAANKLAVAAAPAKAAAATAKDAINAAEEKLTSLFRYRAHILVTAANTGVAEANNAAAPEAAEAVKGFVSKTIGRIKLYTAQTISTLNIYAANKDRILNHPDNLLQHISAEAKKVLLIIRTVLTTAQAQVETILTATPATPAKIAELVEQAQLTITFEPGYDVLTAAEAAESADATEAELAELDAAAEYADAAYKDAAEYADAAEYVTTFITDSKLCIEAIGANQLFHIQQHLSSFRTNLEKLKSNIQSTPPQTNVPMAVPVITKTVNAVITKTVNAVDALLHQTPPNVQLNASNMNNIRNKLTALFNVAVSSVTLDNLQSVKQKQSGTDSAETVDNAAGAGAADAQHQTMFQKVYTKLFGTPPPDSWRHTFDNTNQTDIVSAYNAVNDNAGNENAGNENVIQKNKWNVAAKSFIAEFVSDTPNRDIGKYAKKFITISNAITNGNGTHTLDYIPNSEELNANFELMKRLWNKFRKNDDEHKMANHVIDFIKNNNTFVDYFNHVSEVTREEIQAFENSLTKIKDDDLTNVSMVSQMHIEHFKKSATGRKIRYENNVPNAELVKPTSTTTGHADLRILIEGLLKEAMPDSDINITVLGDNPETKHLIGNLVRNNEIDKLYYLFAFLCKTVEDVQSADNNTTNISQEGKAAKNIAQYMRDRILKAGLVKIGEEEESPTTGTVGERLYSAMDTLMTGVRDISANTATLLTSIFNYFNHTLSDDTFNLPRLTDSKKELRNLIIDTRELIGGDEFTFDGWKAAIMKKMSMKDGPLHSLSLKQNTRNRHSISSGKYGLAINFIQDKFNQIQTRLETGCKPTSEDSSQSTTQHIVEWSSVTNTSINSTNKNLACILEIIALKKEVEKLRDDNDYFKNAVDASIQQSNDASHKRRTRRSSSGKRVTGALADVVKRTSDEIRRLEKKIEDYLKNIAELEEQIKSINNKRTAIHTTLSRSSAAQTLKKYDIGFANTYQYHNNNRHYTDQIKIIEHEIEGIRRRIEVTDYNKKVLIKYAKEQNTYQADINNENLSYQHEVVKSLKFGEVAWTDEFIDNKNKLIKIKNFEKNIDKIDLDTTSVRVKASDDVVFIKKDKSSTNGYRLILLKQLREDSTVSNSNFIYVAVVRYQEPVGTFTRINRKTDYKYYINTLRSTNGNTDTQYVSSTNIHPQRDAEYQGLLYEDLKRATLRHRKGFGHDLDGIILNTAPSVTHMFEFYGMTLGLIKQLEKTGNANVILKPYMTLTDRSVSSSSRSSSRRSSRKTKKQAAAAAAAPAESSRRTRRSSSTSTSRILTKNTKKQNTRSNINKQNQ